MKMVFDLDMDKCVACGACAIACMDQNDVWPNKGDEPYRRIGTINSLADREGRHVHYLSLACMHCEDAPCIKACPVGCLSKNEMNLTVFDNTNCISCHSCAMACPIGAPTYNDGEKMVKCNGCAARLENGMIPACVRNCPTGALICRTEEEYEKEVPEHSLRDFMNYMEKFQA